MMRNKAKIRKYRHKINRIDRKIVDLLAKRFKFSAKIGQIKQEDNQDIHQAKREERILKKVEKRAQKRGLVAEFVKKLYKQIFQESRKAQKQAADEAIAFDKKAKN